MRVGSGAAVELMTGSLRKQKAVPETAGKAELKTQAARPPRPATRPGRPVSRRGSWRDAEQGTGGGGLEPQHEGRSTQRNATRRRVLQASLNELSCAVPYDRTRASSPSLWDEAHVVSHQTTYN